MVICNIISAFFLFRRQPIHDWVTVYALKTLITCFIDRFLVNSGMLEYPVRFLPKYYDTSILFDHIVFPILCVFYNQTSYHVQKPGIIGQAILYSAGMTILEAILEKNTQLITYHNWTWIDTFISLTLTFLAVRGIMAIIRKSQSNIELFLTARLLTCS